MLDSISLLLTHNLRKSISLDLYMTALDVIHRIMRHGVAFQLRISFDWTKLWTSLMAVSRFLAMNKDPLATQSGLHALVRKVHSLHAIKLCR